MKNGMIMILAVAIGPSLALPAGQVAKPREAADEEITGPQKFFPSRGLEFGAVPAGAEDELSLGTEGSMNNFIPPKYDYYQESSTALAQASWNAQGFKVSPWVMYWITSNPTERCSKHWSCSEVVGPYHPSCGKRGLESWGMGAGNAVINYPTLPHKETCRAMSQAMPSSWTDDFKGEAVSPDKSLPFEVNEPLLGKGCQWLANSLVPGYNRLIWNNAEQFSYDWGRWDSTKANEPNKPSSPACTQTSHWCMSSYSLAVCRGKW